MLMPKFWTACFATGHNFGLGHSGTPGDQYGDETSLMGYVSLNPLVVVDHTFGVANVLLLFLATHRRVIIDSLLPPSVSTLVITTI
jgi:hypothetical protein